MPPPFSNTPPAQTADGGAGSFAAAERGEAGGGCAMGSTRAALQPMLGLLLRAFRLVGCDCDYEFDLDFDCDCDCNCNSVINFMNFSAQGHPFFK